MNLCVGEDSCSSKEGSLSILLEAHLRSLFVPQTEHYREVSRAVLPTYDYVRLNQVRKNTWLSTV